MDDKTLEALKGSIRKWEKIENGETMDLGPNNCPLCKLFHSNRNKKIKDDCAGCPISEKTGKRYCHGSPYKDWVDHQEARHGLIGSMLVRCPECVRLAQAELDFLKSLLPEETK